MATIKLKNSQVKGKVPGAGDLDVGGELAVNHHADDPGIFLKDTAGNVRKIAGAGAAGGAWTRTGTTLAPATVGDVVTVSAGTAAAPGLTPVGDPDTGLWAPAADTLALSVKGGEALRIDDQKRVGIGTSSPVAKLDVSGSGNLVRLGDGTNTFVTVDGAGRLGIGTTSPSTIFHIGGSPAAQTTRINSSTSAGFYGVNGDIIQVAANRNPVDGSIVNTGTATAYINLEAAVSNGNIQFCTTASNNTDATERARITADGKMLLGTTTPLTPTALAGSLHAAHGCVSSGYVLAYKNNQTGFLSYDPAGAGALVVVNTGTNGTGSASTGVQLGVSSTSWASYSDERMKADLEPIADGLDKVATLRAVTGRYKTDEVGTSRSFLIAQDVQAVLPEAVSGTTDDDDQLSLRYTEVIPLLVAALKEAKDRIENLEAAVASLTPAP